MKRSRVCIMMRALSSTNIYQDPLRCRPSLLVYSALTGLFQACQICPLTWGPVPAGLSLKGSIWCCELVWFVIPSICRALELDWIHWNLSKMNTTVFPPVGLQRMGKQKWCGTSSAFVTKHDVSADILHSICSGILENERSREYLFQHHCGWSKGKLKSSIVFDMLWFCHIFYLIMWRCVLMHATP